jgi:hypothetical protein
VARAVQRPNAANSSCSRCIARMCSDRTVTSLS